MILFRLLIYLSLQTFLYKKIFKNIKMVLMLSQIIQYVLNYEFIITIIIINIFTYKVKNYYSLPNPAF
jgi:hypothetical protein